MKMAGGEISLCVAECGTEGGLRPAAVNPGPGLSADAGEADAAVNPAVPIRTPVSAIGHFDASPRANLGWAVLYR